MSNAAPAENYYVRNRPFTQVVKAGGEAMVSAEAFLRALGLNWTVDGSVVTLTDRPAANPTLKSGVLTYRYGSSEVQLEGSPRGGATFVSMRPLAKLANYSVAANSQLGIVDVNKARMSTDAEKKEVGEVQAQFAAAQKEKEEAWTKKAAELKEKREKEAEGAKKDEEGAGDAASTDTPKEPKGKDKKDKDKKPEETAATQPTPPVEPKPEEKKPEEKKEANLEALPVNATANSLNGTVTMTCEVRNIGNAPSKGVSGTLTLTGPSRSGSVTDNGNSSSSTWYTKSINGPSVAPGASWTFTETWRHPSGNSMPIGNINASIKLNGTK